MDTPVVITGSTPAEEASAVLAFAQAEKAEATHRAYRSDFELFTAWCHVRRNVEPLGAPAETLAAFLAAQASADVKPSTLTRRLAAIGYAYRLAGLPSPAAHESVRAVLRGIRRKMGTAPKQKAPATAERVAAMLAAIPADTLQGKRDRTLLLSDVAAAGLHGGRRGGDGSGSRDGWTFRCRSF